MTAKKFIPIAAGDTADAGLCCQTEAFALMVLGDSMAPEFVEGDVIIVEPAGVAIDGSYVLAQAAGEWIFRQLVKSGDTWQLRPLNPAFAVMAMSDLSAVKGVIVQKSKPGRRRATKRYVD